MDTPMAVAHARTPQPFETWRRHRRFFGGAQRVWLFIVALVGLAFFLLWIERSWGVVHPSVEIPWWGMALVFYTAERLVLHLRFRQDAHSFSMSEIPLVIGLFFASPLQLVVGQAVGNTVVLTFHRRQPMVKLGFNLAQFAIQSTVAVATFRAVVSLGDMLGPAGWMAAFAGAMAALVSADILINAVIRLSGGRLAPREILEVFALTSLGVAMNTVLALVAVLVLSIRVDAVWIAFMPPAVLYLAYRAYVDQREERSRLEALYEASRALHASPQLESALAAAAAHARRMFDAQIAEITIFPGALDGVAYRTTAGPGDRRDVMRPIAFGMEFPLWRGTLTDPRPRLMSRSLDGIHVDGLSEVKDAIMAPLMGSRGLVGAIVVANRLGDVSTFDREDLRLLETVAGQISVSLENGRLEDSLTQLTVLKERLEALVKSKDEFVAAVSHELRTPLTAIVGLAQELRSNRTTFSDPELDELMAIIADQSGELSNIVEDLLVAARADIGTLNLHPEQVDLRHELATLAATHVVPFIASGEVPIHGSLPELVTDPLRLRQIVRNLLTNAVRYGGDQVWVEAEVGSRTVSIAVLDDGLGVPPESVDKIFEAYERAHSASSLPSSVGLGLAVSRQLARLLGGDLEYRRRDGATAFVLTLPIAGPTAHPAWDGTSSDQASVP